MRAPVYLRLPTSLCEAIQAEACRRDRSVNALLEELLEREFCPQKRDVLDLSKPNRKRAFRHSQVKEKKL